MDRPTVAVVLAGGTGTRLYPASRADSPKQFRAFAGERSLLARTVERAAFADETHVLTRPAFADRVREHAPEAGVLVEPEPRDTGPALVYAAHRLREQVGDCALLCLPSDHFVGDDAAFVEAARRACRVAVETGGLVTLGVAPDRPATGYGYVRPGPDLGGYSPVEEFVEKPDAEAAARYREAGYLWNAGTFAWTPDALLAAARDSPLAPLVERLDAGDAAGGFAAVDPVSVDYAVMEGAENAFVVPADVPWDDLGSWDALGRVLPADESGTVVSGDALTVDAEGCVVATDDETHVSVVGVEDLVVAAYDDRVLVVPVDESQRVREVVASLRERDLF